MDISCVCIASCSRVASCVCIVVIFYDVKIIQRIFKTVIIVVQRREVVAPFTRHLSFSDPRRQQDLLYDSRGLISTDLICKENPLSEGEALPELLPEAGGLLTDTNKKSYIKHRTTDILMLYDYEELPQVDQLPANYFAPDDQSREYIFDILSSTLKKHSEPERKRKLKKI